MSVLRTDKGKTYQVEVVVCPSYDGSCVIRLRDDRLLSEIAPEFEGIQRMEYDDEDVGGSYVFEGYSVLYMIMRGIRDGIVQISLRKPTGGD